MLLNIFNRRVSVWTYHGAVAWRRDAFHVFAPLAVIGVGRTGSTVWKLLTLLIIRIYGQKNKNHQKPEKYLLISKILKLEVGDNQVLSSELSRWNTSQLWWKMSVCNDTWVRAKVEQWRWTWTGHSKIKTAESRERAKDRVETFVQTVILFISDHE